MQSVLQKKFMNPRSKNQLLQEVELEYKPVEDPSKRKLPKKEEQEDL